MSLSEKPWEMTPESSNIRTWVWQDSDRWTSFRASLTHSLSFSETSRDFFTSSTLSGTKSNSGTTFPQLSPRQLQLWWHTLQQSCSGSRAETVSSKLRRNSTRQHDFNECFTAVLISPSQVIRCLPWYNVIWNAWFPSLPPCPASWRCDVKLLDGL